MPSFGSALVTRIVRHGPESVSFSPHSTLKHKRRYSSAACDFGFVNIVTISRDDVFEEGGVGMRFMMRPANSISSDSGATSSSRSIGASSMKESVGLMNGAASEVGELSDGKNREMAGGSVGKTGIMAMSFSRNFPARSSTVSCKARCFWDSRLKFVLGITAMTGRLYSICTSSGLFTELLR